MYQYYIQVSLSLSFFTIISFCISVFCILGVISDIFQLTQPFKQCRLQTAGPSSILFCSLTDMYAKPEGWASLEVWNTLAWNMSLCVYQNFCKNHCLCNINLLIWLCVTCHGNKILLRRQLTYKSICRCNVLPPHDVVVTCHRVVCLRE